MATWDEVREKLERLLGAERITDDVLRVKISLVDEASGQAGTSETRYSQTEVYVTREVIPSKQGALPGIEFVAIDGPLGRVGQTDLMAVIGQAGQLVHGGVTYAQGTESGTLSFGMRLPTDLIDLSADTLPSLFLGYLYQVGYATRDVISELNSPNGRFASRTAQIRQSAWSAIRGLLLGDTSISIGRGNDNALIFSMPGLARKDRALQMFTGLYVRDNGDHSVILEFSLGNFADVDIERAATAAELTRGGVVNVDGRASIRVTLDLSGVTFGSYASSLVELARAAEAYLDGIG
jgi:hypothetical protein